MADGGVGELSMGGAIECSPNLNKRVGDMCRIIHPI